MNKVKSKSNLKKQTEVITIQYLFGVYILLYLYTTIYYY